MPKVATLYAEITAKTDGFKRGVQQVETGTNSMSRSLGKVQKNSAGASQAILALSGGVQDLPYGFRGVVNNAEFAAQSFSQLVAKAGGLRAALAAVGGALAGPAGLLLGFSAITASLQILPKLFGDSTRAAKGFTEALEGMVKVTNDLGDIEFGFSPEEARRTADAIRQELKALQAAPTVSGAFGAFGAGPVVGAVPGSNISEAERKRREENERLRQILQDQLDTLEDQLAVVEAVNRQRTSGSGIAGRTPAGLTAAQARNLRRFNPAGFGFTPPSAGGDGSAIPGVPSGAQIAHEALGELREGLGYLTNDLEQFDVKLQDNIFTLREVNRPLVEFADNTSMSNVGLAKFQQSIAQVGLVALQDFALSLGDAIVGLAFFGESLKDTLTGIGRSLVGSLVGGAITVGSFAALNAIPGVGTLAAIAGAATIGGGVAGKGAVGSNSNVGLSLSRLQVEGQRARVRNGLQLLEIG